MERIENTIGYSFRNKEYLKLALTHSSYSGEIRKGRLGCNERLEFLGDSILGFVVADYLYRNEPDSEEGILSRTRADIVCETNLAKIASEIRLGDALLLGKGERSTGGALRNSVTSDAVEALIAAVYLDGGFEEAKRLIYRLILSRPIPESPAASDYKTRIQELIQTTPGHILRYELVGESGPDHDKSFVCAVILDDEKLAEGTGTSKKRAEQEAARNALERIAQMTARRF